MKKSILLQLFCIISLANAYAQQVSVRSFGAKGNGIADDTKAIAAAIRSSATNKKILYFPEGIYLVRNLDITVSFTGVAGKTRIKKLNDATNPDIYTFCNIRNKENISVNSIIFDGSVLGTDIKPLLGAIPLFVYGARNIVVTNCFFVNSPSCGLRIESSENISITKSKVENLNGAFGDGVYIENSKDVKLEDLIAHNYTRIGFVVEKNSRTVQINKCKASNGHSASILHGGTEFNAGFWAELAADVRINECLSENNKHYGYVLTSGVEEALMAKSKIASFNITNSKSINNPVGYRVSSSGNPVDIKVVNCKATSANQGFVAFARDKRDKFTFSNCFAEIVEPAKESFNDAGYMWESEINNANEYPIFIYQNCFTSFKGRIPVEKLYSRETNVADLSTYSGGNANILIDKMKNNTPSGKPVIKAIKGNPKFEIVNTIPDLNYLNKKERVIIR